MNLIPALLASASNPTTAEIYGGMLVAILLLATIAANSSQVTYYQHTTPYPLNAYGHAY